MPLPLPKLDDRRWSDLVEEGRALIPRYAPAWTDHNVHDPGITLLELFAWLTETTLYRLDRVPERHRRKFIALIGCDPAPPRASHSVVTFAASPGTAPFVVPQGTQFETTDPSGQPVRFRTLVDVTVAEVDMKAVQIEETDASGARVTRDRTQDWQNHLPITVLDSRSSPPACLYLGFATMPVEVPISIAFRCAGPGSDLNERARIAEEAQAQRAASRSPLADMGFAEDMNERKETTLTHHSARVVWEVHTGDAPDPWRPLEPVAESESPAPGEVRDDTRALTLDGMIEINLPNALVATALGEVAQPLFYLRCRLAGGAHDAPPALLDIAPVSVAVEQAAPVAQSHVIAAGVIATGPAPAPGSTSRFTVVLDEGDVIRALAFDPPDSSAPAVTILAYEPASAAQAGRITWELACIGRGRGIPNARVSLPQAPVQVESLALHTHAADRWETWSRRDSFDGSRRTDLHYVLDATSGEIAFGDGERGRAPPKGSVFFAAYRATRADQGNMDAGRLMRLADSARNALWLDTFAPNIREQLRSRLSTITRSRSAAVGGSAVESLTAATGRAIEAVHAHERLLEIASEARTPTLDQLDTASVRALCAPTRAINLLDIERLVLDVPGTRIARARAWASLDPAYPCLSAPGAITVVIVPDQPVAAPTPSVGLCEAVRRYLDRRRVVTMRVEVVGPQYLEARVQVRVRTKPFSDPLSVRDRIQKALDDFLDPRHGGSDGRGWPFGRDVYRSEILQLIDGVSGVDHVLTLTLTAGTSEAQCGNLQLCPTSLVSSGLHQIEIERGTA